jgi:hypothetical protein
MIRSIAFVLSVALASSYVEAAPKPGPWKSLFDGKSLDAWRTYKSEAPPQKWQIKDGVLTKDGNASDLISKDEFGDFEFELEWRIGEAGNSGIFYRGTEEYDAIYWSAPEYQLLDNVKASDNKRPDHLAGALYEFSSPPPDAVKPIGEWNLTRIVAKGNHLEHWLNGRKTAEFEIGSPEWDAKLAASKFKVWPNFARAKKGHVGIQGNHPGELSLRHIRIRELQ